MIKLSQRDPRWATKTIGTTKVSVGKMGCTLTSLCMIADYFGTKIMPDSMAALKQYNAQAKIIWTKIKLPLFAWEYRAYKREDVKIKKYLADPKKAVMLEVNNGQHWVVAVKVSTDGKSYIVRDPWTGTDVDVIKVYHNITGAAYFTKA